MRSFKLFTSFGINVKVHSSFFILIAVIFLITLAQANLATALFTTALLLMLFVCVLLHEFGHSLTTLHFGGKVQGIVLFPLGGLSQIEEFNMTPRQEILMAGVGPFINFVIAAILLVGIGDPTVLPASPEQVFTMRFFLIQLFWLNVLVGAFNLLPVYPMDGGRIFRALLSLKLSQDKATKVAATVGQIAASIMTGVGLLYNPWLAIIGLFLFLAASAEKSRVSESEA